MYIYYLLIFLTVFLWIVIGKKNKKMYVIVMCIAFTLVAGLRKYNIGNDTGNYIKSFNEAIKYGTQMIILSRFEKGYVLLEILISKISISYNALLLMTSLLINALICNFIYKNSKNICFSFLLFILCRFFFGEMNIIRQFIAIGIVLYSIKYIENRQFIKFLLTIIIASLFHNSAIFMLPFYFIYNIEIKSITKVFIIIIFAIMYGFLYNILTTVTNWFGLYTNYVENYINSNKLASIIAFIISLLIYIYIRLTKDRKKEKTKESNIDTYEKKENFFNNILLFLVCINFVAIKMSILSRISAYLEIFYIIIIPNHIDKNIKSKDKITWYAIFFICFFAYFIIITYLRPDWNSINPYKFFWQ